MATINITSNNIFEVTSIKVPLSSTVYDIFPVIKLNVALSYGDIVNITTAGITIPNPNPFTFNVLSYLKNNTSTSLSPNVTLTNVGSSRVYKRGNYSALYVGRLSDTTLRYIMYSSDSSSIQVNINNGYATSKSNDFKSLFLFFVVGSNGNGAAACCAAEIDNSPSTLYVNGSLVDGSIGSVTVSYQNFLKVNWFNTFPTNGNVCEWATEWYRALTLNSYTITVTESDRGTCTVDKTEAAENDTVRVTVKPNLGQKLYHLYVVGETVGTISVTTESENVYSFTMPADNVKVSAVFMSNDAYVPAGEDAEDLGGGDYSDISDPVPVPSVPSISASNIGMVTLFRPSLQNILDLGQYLYTDWWELGDNLKKWLSNPIEAMIGFNIVPCIPAVGTDRVVKLGIVSTGVSMPPVNSQWYDFDCGTIDITPYTGTMLDYAPNTKIQIMLPFIGSSALDTDEVMNRTLGLKYRIDLLSGACVAMLTINGDVHYQWTGECAVNIPFSASDFSRVYGAVLGAVGAGVTGFMAAGAAGVASQAGAQAAIASATRNNLAASKAFDKAIGDVVKGSRGAPALRQQLKEASSNAMQKAISEAGNAGNIAGSIKAAQIARTVNNVVGQVMSAKGGVAHSGTISGAAGMLGVRTPYVIIEYPNQSLPENYRHFVGYPSNITARLGDLTGYTECEQLIANGITGTDSEYTELVEALKGGVYL